MTHDVLIPIESFKLFITSPGYLHAIFRRYLFAIELHGPYPLYYTTLNRRMTCTIFICACVWITDDAGYDHCYIPALV